MSFDFANFALKSVCPNNRIIHDDKEMPSVFVYIPKFRLCDVLSTDDTTVHPAFKINGTEIPGFWCAKYQSHIYNGRAYSLPAEAATDGVTPENLIAYNRAKGGYFHEITNAEWAAIAMWCHKNGTEPKGNNSRGMDVSETVYKAIPTRWDGSLPLLVAGGTGPLTWSHDQTPGGIWDLNGNVAELCTGIRLVKGELQVLKDNDAAAPGADLSESSSAWKAIKAGATSWSDIYLTPNGSGTTTGSVKLDYVSDAWKWSTSITSQNEAFRSCEFKDITADSSVGAIAKKLLMALALMPDTSLTGTGIDANYGHDKFGAQNSSHYQINAVVRGGACLNGADAGVFMTTFLYNPDTLTGIGGRSAYIDPLS